MQRASSSTMLELTFLGEAQRIKPVWHEKLYRDKAARTLQSEKVKWRGVGEVGIAQQPGRYCACRNEDTYSSNVWRLDRTEDTAICRRK